MKQLLLAVIGLLVLNTASADVVTPTGVIATSQFGVGIEIENLINGSGLIDVNATPENELDDVHDFPTDAITMWHAGDSDAGIPGGLDDDGDPFTAPPVDEQIVEFDLGAVFELSQMHIWNMNQGDPGFGPLGPINSVDEMEVFISTTESGDTFASLGLFNLAVGSGLENIPAETVALSGTDLTARRVRFDINTTHGGGANDFVGLSEVRFEGIPIDSGPDADFDDDGDVDGNDFLLWQGGFPLPSGAVKMDGDADNDGDVDGNDFLIWQTEFPFPGSGAGSAAVPEPASLALLLCGLAAVSARRRSADVVR